MPVKGRFREGHEAVRDATGPSRLSSSSRGTKASCVQIRRVTYGSRGRTAQGPSNATTLVFSQGIGGEVPLGVCKPLIRRVRSACVKATVHRCDSLLMCVFFIAHQAAGSHTAQAFRTPFSGELSNDLV